MLTIFLRCKGKHKFSDHKIFYRKYTKNLREKRFFRTIICNSCINGGCMVEFRIIFANFAKCLCYERLLSALPFVFLP